MAENEIHPADSSSPQKNSLRRQRRREETKEKIFRAAMDLLAERDFDAVTVEMITEAADVGKGTFFNYFENKEAVVGYHFERVFSLLTETLRAAQKGNLELPHHISRPDAPGPIFRLMCDIAHFVADNECQSKRLMRTLLALSLTNPLVFTACESVKGRMMELLLQTIHIGQSTGELRDDIALDVLVEYLASGYFGSVFRWVKMDDVESDIHDIIDLHYALIWSGVRKL